MAAITWVGMIDSGHGYFWCTAASFFRHTWVEMCSQAGMSLILIKKQQSLGYCWRVDGHWQHRTVLYIKKKELSLFDNWVILQHVVNISTWSPMSADKPDDSRMISADVSPLMKRLNALVWSWYRRESISTRNSIGRGRIPIAHPDGH